MILHAFACTNYSYFKAKTFTLNFTLLRGGGRGERSSRLWDKGKGGGGGLKKIIVLHENIRRAKQLSPYQCNRSLSTFRNTYRYKFFDRFALHSCIVIDILG